MSNHSKGKTFKMLNVEDLNYISGGATVVEKIDDKFFKTSRTQKCSCGLFEPLVTGVTLDICDNCKQAQTPYEGSEITYCSKQIK